MDEPNRLLFVYGTLRRGDPGGLGAALLADAQALGPARLRGRLLDLGDYPGLVDAGTGPGWVAGELYRLSDPRGTLARLDAYEGCAPDSARPHEFERVSLKVLDAGQRSVRAFVYRYTGARDGRRLIRGGDWLADRAGRSQPPIACIVSGRST